MTENIQSLTQFAIAILGMLGAAFGLWRLVIMMRPEKSATPAPSPSDSSSRHARADGLSCGEFHAQIRGLRADCERLDNEREQLWGAINDLRTGISSANASLENIKGALGIGGR